MSDEILNYGSLTQPSGPVGGRAALAAGFLGWTLDAFDYFLVVLTLTAIGKEFHKSDVEMSLALFITLAFRPVGALIFGLLADRYGRRLPLMLDLVFFSIIEVLSGLAPNFTTFLILRALFGIGMGGEWGTGASLTMEKVSAKRRGFLSGILQEGYAAGYLLAAVAYYGFFPHWGWRPLFFLGGIPALLAIYVRFKVPESEAWEKNKPASWGELGNGILNNLPIFVYLVALMTMMNLSSHGTQDLYPTFLQRVWHVTAGQKSAITIVSMIGAIIGGITFGYFSDRIGRRNAIVTAFLLGLGTVYFWAQNSSMAILFSGAFLLQFMVQGAWGVIPAHICELSPGKLRGFLPGFAYQCGNLLASLVSPIQAKIAETHGYGKTLGISAVIIFIVAAAVAGLGDERHGVGFVHQDTY